MSRSNEAILERFAEAVVTGEYCGTSEDGPRRWAALSLPGLGILTRRKLWPAAMHRVIDLQAHERAQARFLEGWCRVPMSMVREWVGNDDVFFRGLRVLLPPYRGPTATLFRGQVKSEPVGMSWTRSFAIAQKFALYGIENVNPHGVAPPHIKARANPIVLLAKAHDEIICAPCLLGQMEGEYIVDPRGLAVVECGAQL